MENNITFNDVFSIIPETSETERKTIKIEKYTAVTFTDYFGSSGLRKWLIVYTDYYNIISHKDADVVTFNIYEYKEGGSNNKSIFSKEYKLSDCINDADYKIKDGKSYIRICDILSFLYNSSYVAISNNKISKYKFDDLNNIDKGYYMLTNDGQYLLYVFDTRMGNSIIKILSIYAIKDYLMDNLNKFKEALSILIYSIPDKDSSIYNIECNAYNIYHKNSDTAPNFIKYKYDKDILLSDFFNEIGINKDNNAVNLLSLLNDFIDKYKKRGE